METKLSRDYMMTGEDLITTLTYNVYGKPHYIIWDTPKKAQTACSSFITLLLCHIFNWKMDKNSPFKKYIGTISPYSNDYTKYVMKNSKNTMIKKIDDILSLKRGDFIFIDYLKTIDGSTGHSMLVSKEPEEITPIKPIIKNTKQYKVYVLDSTKSFHGKIDDTRLTKPGGIGLGYIRIYTNLDNTMVGYSWSLSTSSIYYPDDERNIIGGTLNYDQLTKDGFLKN